MFESTRNESKSLYIKVFMLFFDNKEIISLLSFFIFFILKLKPLLLTLLVVLIIKALSFWVISMYFILFTSPIIILSYFLCIIKLVFVCFFLDCAIIIEVSHLFQFATNELGTHNVIKGLKASKHSCTVLAKLITLCLIRLCFLGINVLSGYNCTV